MPYESAIGSNLFHDLIETWKKAIEEEKLQELDKDLLPKVVNKIEEIKEESREKFKGDSLFAQLVKKEIEIIKFLINDIVKIRQSKLLKKILEEETPEPASPFEKEFAKTIRENMDTLRKRLTSKGSNEHLSTLTFEIDKIEEFKRKNRNLPLISANKKISSFVTENDLVFRDIKGEDILKVPENNLKLFEKRDAELFDRIEIEDKPD